MLGMNTNIKDAKGLPSMDAEGKIPKDLGKTFGQMILEADGFAQVRRGTHAQLSLLASSIAAPPCAPRGTEGRGCATCACPAGLLQVYPEHKYLIVEALRQAGFAVGMTGDGVNDAPALKRADVGVAVQGATDAARAAADIVLTQPGLSTVVEAIIVARCIFQRMKNFIK